MKPKSQSEREKEFTALAEANWRVRRQFLEAEFHTCSTTLEIGEYEAAAGNADKAEEEIALVEKGVATIQRFLPGLGAEHGSGAAKKLADVQARLEALKTRVRSRRPQR